jgi:membrane protein DedA with SNARE-associated domain
VHLHGQTARYPVRRRAAPDAREVLPPLMVAAHPPTASLTEPLVEFATDVVGELGVAGIFLLMLLDSACIPTSSEAIMLFAGFEVADGRFTMLEIVIAGVAGNVVGSWVAYWLGYYGRMELLERHGKWFHVTPAHLAWADRWFERYGNAAVFFSRMLPVIRTFISLPAGVAKMPFWRFTVLSTAGIIPWVTAFAIAGEQVGSRWDEWREKLSYADYVIVGAIAIFAVYLLLRRRRSRQAARTRTPAPDTTT